MNTTRIRDYGIQIGDLPTGGRNSIADVKGVTVGHHTIDNENSKTGVTVIMPTPENIFRKKLLAACYVLNGYGKSAGLIQVAELGTLESPIALTNTLNVGLVHEGLVDYMVKRCQKEGVPIQSFNPVVGECNDCHINNIIERAVRPEHVALAIENASSDFAQGDVGAGKGTLCYGLKGGIGSASRQIEIDGKIYTIGVLVQSNFGRTKDLLINHYPLGEDIYREIQGTSLDKGSILSVLATDLPLSSRQLHRVLKRLGMGLARTGSFVGNGSGDIMLGFTTANPVDASKEEAFHEARYIKEDLLDTVFRAAIQSEEEAVLNSMIAADPVTSYTGKTYPALRPYLEKYRKEKGMI